MKSAKSVESKSQWKNEVDRLEEIKSKLEDESSKIVIAHHKDCEGKKNMRRNGIIMKCIGGILFIIFILAFVVALCIIRFNVQPSILG